MSVPDSTLLEYDICMESAERRVFHLLHSLEWQLISDKKNGRVWKMRCNVTENYMFRYEGIIPNRTPTEVAVIVHPEGAHRALWDTQSAGTPLIARIRDDTSIIRHDTKSRLMGIISQREAVDLCRFATDSETGCKNFVKIFLTMDSPLEFSLIEKNDPLSGTRSVVMVSVSHPSAPLREGIVRVHTHPSLLLIAPSGSDTKVTSIIQAEMHLMGIPPSVVDNFLPKGIINFFDDLRAYTAKDLKLDLNEPLTGWI
ncbi:unnamed protein product [Nippostrongylus brasiliensis]|uniref:START domain-containing protein n=1 Tax=Nippostrongylus brasiliensis TaxID=27835 RepID=A0A0N4YAH5_NIPBR|nr:unnamed protein product [Nippostrongylus brasiliensis]